MTSQLVESDLFDFLRGDQWAVQNGHLPKAHAVIADPPYFLGSIAKRFGGKNAAAAKFGRDGAFQRQSRGFMGKTWDGFDSVWSYQAWVTEWASLLIDFVYPGAILAMFGGTRTYHRLAAGLEDAGWEVFDCMMYVYGSGFPKAADIGKLIDKSEGAEREVVGYGDVGGLQDNHKLNDDGWHGAGAKNRILTITHAAHSDAQRFDGYKTALKPAYEPIVLARAPRGDATYADLAQQFGTGAINIDAARIEYRSDADYHKNSAFDRAQPSGSMFTPKGGLSPAVTEQGRYPSNIILDAVAAELLDAQSGELKNGGDNSNSPARESMFGTREAQVGGSNFAGDSGGASRFFYTAKAATWEREAGLAGFDAQPVSDGRQIPADNAYQRGDTPRKNTHPTVKPIQLIEYLARLFLPPQLDTPRRLLIPFAGSGSEMIGAQLAGWEDVVGIERETEYCAINKARRTWWSKQPTYAAAQLAYRQETRDAITGQSNMFDYLEGEL